MGVDQIKEYYSLNGLDKKLETWLNYDDGFFVELGANNGIDQSNTYYFEKYRNWHGVLIEPTPHNYLMCRSNRSSKNHIVCGACVSFDYTDEFVKMIYSNLMSTSVGLESDIDDPFVFANEGRKFLSDTDDVFVFGAQAKTLNQILLDSGAPGFIDLLSLDVEGAEIEVLKGINHDNFKFKFICVECRNLSKMIAFLMPLGYCLLDQLSPHDYLFAYKFKTLGL